MDHDMDEGSGSESDAFAPMPLTRNLQPRQKPPHELGPKISRARPPTHADMQAIHESIIDFFISHAKELDDELRNREGIKHAIFSEREYREMATSWTTSISKMFKIRGIDKTKVEKYGVKFAALVERYHAQFQNTVKANQGGDIADYDMEDLATSDNDDLDYLGSQSENDEDLDENVETSHYFQSPPPNDPESEYFHPPGDPTLVPDAWLAEWNRLAEASKQNEPEINDRRYEQSKRKSEISKNSWKKKQNRRSTSAGPSGSSARVSKWKSQGQKQKGTSAPARGRSAKNAGASSGIATMPH